MIDYLKESNYFDKLQSTNKHSHNTITTLSNISEDLY